MEKPALPGFDFAKRLVYFVSDLLDGQISHDKVTRLLNSSLLRSQDLWKLVKPIVRAHTSDDGILILDDTISEKPYSDESEMN